MALKRLKDYRREYERENPGSKAPDARTLIKMIENKQLYGFQTCQNGAWWVDPERDPIVSLDNPLVQKVLSE